MSPASPRREEIAEALRTSTEIAPESHPEIDEIFEYHAGTLDAERFERVQSHLLVCRRCLDDLLDLETFVQAPANAASESGSIDFEAASAWRRVRAKIVQPGAPRPGAPRLVLPLAASLVVAVLGLAWAFQQRADLEALRQEVARLEAPRPDARIVDLYPVSGVRGEGSEAPPSLSSAVAGLATVILHLPEPVDGVDAYAVEIVDAEDRQVWTGVLTMEEFGLLSLALPASFLDPGDYRVLVSVDFVGDRRFLESYPLRVLSTQR